MWTVMSSPIGDLRIIERDGAISAIEFTPFRQPPDGRPLGARGDDHPLLAEAVRQLTAYFGRELTDFDLPLAPVGTEFQRRVWEQLEKIAYGDTASYGEVAGRLGMRGIEVADPYVERLLEGFAFMSARIQLKMDAEFPRFSQRLLDLVYPGYLAPTPAMATRT